MGKEKGAQFAEDKQRKNSFEKKEKKLKKGIDIWEIR